MARAKGPPVPRDEKGLWQPGVSPNPGGATAEQRAARRAFVEHLPEAVTLVLEMMRGDDKEDRRFALDKVFNRSLGKEGKASELPTLLALVAPLDNSTESLLSETRGLFAKGLAGLKAQLDAGEVGSDALERLQGLSSGLQSLVRAEEEARRAGSLAGLSTDELVALVAKLLPREALEQMLRTKQAEEGT